MMNKAMIINELKDILPMFLEMESGSGVIELHEDDILISDEYSIDSVALVQIVLEIERRFDISVDDEYLSIDFLSSIGNMANLVEEMISDQK